MFHEISCNFTFPVTLLHICQQRPCPFMLLSTTSILKNGSFRDLHSKLHIFGIQVNMRIFGMIKHRELGYLKIGGVGYVPTQLTH